LFPRLSSTPPLPSSSLHGVVNVTSESVSIESAQPPSPFAPQQTGESPAMSMLHVQSHSTSASAVFERETAGAVEPQTCSLSRSTRPATSPHASNSGPDGQRTPPPKAGLQEAVWVPLSIWGCSMQESPASTEAIRSNGLRASASVFHYSTGRATRLSTKPRARTKFARVQHPASIPKLYL